MTDSPIWQIVSPHLEGLKRAGQSNAKARCPFHDDRTPSFYINTENGLWICFSCHIGGTLQKLLRLLGRSPAEIESVSKPVRDSIRRQQKLSWIDGQLRYRNDPFLGENVIPESVLAPYDYCPKALLEEGFSKTLLRSFGVGYDNDKDRITYPIRDVYGNLVGVVGRSTIGEEPRYKFYKRGTHNKPGDFGEAFDEMFPKYDFHKSRYLWNADTAIPLLSKDPLVIVEGFKACMAVARSGIQTVVATMGSMLSRSQFDILRRLADPVVFFFDNDPAGRDGVKKAAPILRRTNPNVKVVKYPEWASNFQPDDFSEELTRRLIDDAERWTCIRTCTTRS